MAKIQNKAKRVLAVAIALMMVLGACFTGIVTASAAGLAEGLTAVATTSTQGYSSTSNASVFTDIEGGGVTISTGGHGAYRPYLHNFGVPQFPNGGVTLQFDNFVSTSPESHAGVRGYQSFMIVLSNTLSDSNGNACRLRTSAVPAFVIDTYNGNVDFVKGDDSNNYAMNSHILVQRVIENNDTIKYANITGKAFTITFNYDVNGDITVDVAVDGAVASGVLDANKFASVANTNAKLTYFSISAVDNGAVDAEGDSAPETNSFNYYGYKTLDLAPAFLSGLSSVASYDTSTGYFKSNTHWGAVTQGDVQHGMVGALSGGGVYLDVFQHAGYGSLQFPDNLGGYNGNFELLLGGYRATGTAEEEGYGQIGFVFQNAANLGNSSVYCNSFIIGLDTITGTLALMQSKARDGRTKDQVVTLATIATDDALKMENFQGKLFKLRWTQSADGENVDIAIVMKDKTVSGSFAKSLLSTRQDAAQTNYSLNASNAFLALSNIYGTTSNAGAYELYINYYGVNKGVAPAYVEAARAQALAGIATPVSAADNGYAATATYLSDIAGGGVHYAPSVQSGYFPYNLSAVDFGAWPTVGFKLAFANYVDKATTGDHGKFAIRFSRRNQNSGSYDLMPKVGNVSLIINTVDGQIELAKTTAENTQTIEVLLEDDLFLYENFTGKAFFVEGALSGRATNEMEIKFTVDKESRSVYVMPEDMLTFPEGHTGNNFGPSSACYIGFSEKQNGAPVCSVDFMGYTKGVTPAYITDAVKNVDVVASLATTPDGRVNANSTETDVAGGGILVNGLIGYDAYNLAYNFGGWPGDGLKLQFANYVNTNASDDNAYKFALMLGNTSSVNMQAWKGGNVMIVINGQTGVVELVKCYGQQLQWKTVATLIEDDAFLYDNFTGKAFSFTFKLSGRKSNEVQMDLAVGDNVFTGYIDYAVMMAHSDEDTDFSDAFEYNGEMQTADWYYPTASTLYVGFGGMDNDSKGSFYFLGYTDGIASDYMTDLQASVENTVTVDDNVYKSGTPNCITNINGGGVHYQAIGHYPFQLGTGMDCWPGNGFKLQFANYAEVSNNTTAAGYGQFVVYFNYAINGNTTYGPFWKGGHVGFNINTVDGQVELVKSDFKGLSTDGAGTGANTVKYVDKVLVEDAMFLYENFAGTAFSYEILPAGFDNAARVIITVGDKAVSFVITYEELTSRPDYFQTNEYYPKTTWDGKTSQCNVSFSALLHDNTQAAVDFIGFTKYAAGSLSVGSTNTNSYEATSVPVSVTTEAEQTMSIEVKADADITGIVAADGVEIDYTIDGTTAIVNVLTAVAGTDVKLFDVQFTTGDATIYTVEANVVADADGNKPSIRGAKGGVVVATFVPEFTDVKKQATEGAYKLGTLGFATSTAALASSVGDSFVAIEFGTVFFTQKMLGDQDLVIGTKAANGGTAQAITVSKTLASNEELPEQFIAILKDKASNTSDSVSEAYANTTFVARSFVRFMDTDTGAIFIVYGDTFAQKLADLA